MERVEYQYTVTWFPWNGPDRSVTFKHSDDETARKRAFKHADDVTEYLPLVERCVVTTTQTEWDIVRNDAVPQQPNS